MENMHSVASGQYWTTVWTGLLIGLMLQWNSSMKEPRFETIPR